MNSVLQDNLLLIFGQAAVLWFYGLGIASLVHQHKQYLAWHKKLVVALWKKNRGFLSILALGVLAIFILTHP